MMVSAPRLAGLAHCSQFFFAGDACVRVLKASSEGSWVDGRAARNVPSKLVDHLPLPHVHVVEPCRAVAQVADETGAERSGRANRQVRAGCGEYPRAAPESSSSPSRSSSSSALLSPASHRDRSMFQTLEVAAWNPNGNVPLMTFSLKPGLSASPVSAPPSVLLPSPANS